MRFLKLASVCVCAVVVLAGCGGAINAKIGGEVTGLASGNSVGLTLNNTEAITVKSNTSFAFATTVATGGNYNVFVSTYPTGQNCTVTNGTGTISSNGGDVTNITVTCSIGTASTVPITASVTGLTTGANLVLACTSANCTAQDTLTITGDATTTTGTKTFNFPVNKSAGTYIIGIQTNPASCLIQTPTNGVVTISNSSTGSPTAPSPVVITC